MKICVIATGGTIDKDYPKSIGGYAFEFGTPAIQRNLEQWNPNFEFDFHCPFQKDSLEIQEEDRMAIVQIIKDSPFENFIITHGTDTMLETGEFLSPIFTDQKIIITGAMRPQRFSNSDAPYNIGGALAALQIVKPGVYIFIQGVLKKWDEMERDLETGKFY